MDEVTVTNEKGEVIAHIFIEDGDIKAMVQDYYIVNVDGKELIKDTQ